MKFLIIPVICPYVSRGQKPNTMGERSVRIRKVREFDPPRVHHEWKITAKLAVIFRLTTIIPQTE